jgi:hypothetical protein
MNVATRPTLCLRLRALAALSVVLLFGSGAAHAATSGTVVAWGCAGAFTDHEQCNVPSGLSGVTMVAAGFVHSLALKADGTVVVWGCDGGAGFGQCRVPGGLAGVTAIAAGTYHSLALKGDGTVVAWGCSANDDGQCSVPSGLAGVTAIAAGAHHSLALKSDGTVVAWGCGVSHDYGQCSVPSGLSGVTAIAAGTFHSLALKGDGTVVAWGCQDNSPFCSVPSALSGVTAIAAGDYQSVALKGDGTVALWGCGQLGVCDVPMGLSGVTAIASGLVQSLAVKRDGTVVAWGCGASFAYGQCSVPSGLCGATALAAGAFHSLALLAKTCQTIAFGPLGGRTFGDADFAVSAPASSGLPVSFAASGTCTVSVSTVHLVGAGSCTITASQAGDANYAAAPAVSQAFAVAKADQTITFGPLASKTVGDPDFAVSASASSGLPVSFGAGGSCTVSAATVHLNGVGSCAITASQPGDANYNPAPDVTRTFSIARAPCTVPKVVGKPLAAAKSALAQRHCRTGKVGYAYSRKSRKGTVTSQGRRPGQVLPADSKIDLVVSRGRRA